MKKMFLLLALPLASMATWAQTFQSGDFTYVVLDEEARTAALSRVPDTYRGAVVVPETVTNEGTTYTVTQIGSPASATDYYQSAFYYSTIESLTIPATVTKVTGSMFYYTISDPAIQQVTIADSPNPITFDAIGYTEHIENLYIGRDIVFDNSFRTDPGTAVFVNTDHVVIGPQVTTLRNNMFSGTGGYLVSIDLSQATSLTTLGTNVFYNSNNVGLTTIDLSKTKITSVPDNTFMYCDKLTTIKLPGTVQTIGHDAFHYCTALKDLTIPASVTSIGSQAFWYDTEMESLTIEDSETPLVLEGNYGDGLPGKTFYLGRDLVGAEGAALTKRIVYTNAKNVTVGPKVTTLPANAFSGAGAVESFDFSNATSLTTLGENAFYSCSNEKLTSIDLRNTKITAIPDRAFSYCSYLATPYLPNTVQTIGYRAFYYCSKLESITIPASVTTIGNEVFYYTDNIKSFTIEDGTTTLACGTIGDGFSGETFYLGRNVTYTSTSFGRLIFTNVKNVTLGPNVTTLNNYMFARPNMETFDWSQATGITTVPDRCFDNCDGLRSFTIPANIATIEATAFYNMDGDMDLTIADSDTPLTLNNANSSFYPIFEYNNVTAYIGRNILRTGSYEGRSVLNVRSDKEHHLTFGPKVTTIGDQEYYNCDALRSVDFSAANVTSIGVSAFRSCDNLTTIDLGTKLETLGHSAFSGCSELTAITIPATLKVLPNPAEDDRYGVFEDCSKLATVVLNEGLEEIGHYAFYSCSALTEIILPSSLKKIGRAPFYNADDIKRLIISDSETALTFDNEPGSPFTSGNYYLYDNPLDYFYMGRNITCRNTSNSLISSSKDIEIGPKVTNIDKLFESANTVENVKVNSLTPIAISVDPFHSNTYENATLWLPGGTKAAYQAADYWKNFTKMEFSSYVVSIATTGHGTLAVADIEAGNGESESTLIDRETDVTFTATADTGYELTAFTVNDETKTTTDGQYTVTNLLADQAAAATFAPITYTIAYDLAGGSVAGGSSVSSYTIESEAITLVNPTRTGYTFAGWTGTALDAATAEVTIHAGSTGDRAYTANWTPITYTIAYDLAGGSVAGGSSVSSYTIESEAITLVNPTRTGYTFAGWTGTALDGSPVEVTIPTGSTGNRSYTATWTINQYTITFNSNGGSAVAAITQDYASAVTAPAAPTREGYTFAGWTPALPATIPAEDISVEAQWTINHYSVSITGAGVSADETNPAYGEAVVITIAEDEDRSLTSLTVNGTDVTSAVTGNQYTITSVSGDVEVVATFSSTKEFITMAHAQQTFSCSQDLDFSAVSGLTAYIASGYNKATGMVLMTKVDGTVPAGTGLLLVGTEGETYKVPYTTSDAYYVNLLQPVLTAQTVAQTEGAYTNFLYGEKDDVKGFYKSSGTGTVAAQKAYLQLPTAALPSETKAIGFYFDDETGISDMAAEGAAPEGVYDIHGRKIPAGQKLTRGIYVINGKKVSVK